MRLLRESEEGDAKLDDPKLTIISKAGEIVEIPQAQRKIRVRGVDVKIINERVQYIDPNGELITESLKDYTRNNVKKEYASLDNFIQKWNSADSKKAIMDELEQQGVLGKN